MARDEIGGLDFSDLAFRPEEIRALFAQNQSVELTDADTSKLVEATEGWIAAIQFADLGRLRGGEDPFPARHAVALVCSIIWDSRCLSNRRRTYRFSCCERRCWRNSTRPCATRCWRPFTPSNRIGSSCWRQFEKNLYALPAGAGTDGQWLRYHHLFRDYLQVRYRREFPQEIDAVLQRLAGVREQQGEWEAAYQLYRQLGDQAALADLIERAGTTMYRNACRFTSKSWLDDLPPSVVRKRPGLLSLRGAVEHMRGHASEAVSLLDHGHQPIAGRGKP